MRHIYNMEWRINMHLVVDNRVGELITSEVNRRNRYLKPGQRKHNKRTVTEEIVLSWEEKRKSK